MISITRKALSSWTQHGRHIGPRPRRLLPRHSRLVATGALLFGLYFGLAAAAPAATPAPDGKWRIVCLHNALSDGVIMFRLTPVGGQPLELQVPIKDGTFENEVAVQVRNVFRAALPKDLYHVERDDGEAVLVKKQRGKPDFSLEFVSHSINGLGIRVELD